MYITPAWFTELEQFMAKSNGPSYASLPGPDTTPRPRLDQAFSPVWPAPDGTWTGPSAKVPYFNVEYWELSPREQNLLFAIKHSLRMQHEQTVTCLEREITRLKRRLAKHEITDEQRSLLRELKETGALDDFLEEDDECCECCDCEEDDECECKCEYECECEWGRGP